MPEGTPLLAPRYYGYFKGIKRKFTVPGFGVVDVNPSISWFGIPDADVLLLNIVRTPLALGPNDITHELVEFAVVTNNQEHFQNSVPSTNGADPQGFLIPAYGIYMKVDTLYPSTVENRSYYGREAFYKASDLIGVSDPDGPVELFIQGVNAVESYLDSASWSGPGSAIVYDREASFGWLEHSGAEAFELSQHASWRPGRAHSYERFLFGSGVTGGVLDGWIVYAIERVIIVEFWSQGIQIANRSLDCAELLDVPDSSTGASTLEHVIGLGYDFEKGLVSLGVSVNGAGGSHVVHKEWTVPALVGFGYQHPRVGIGGAPLDYLNGAGQRSSWGLVKPIQGVFTDSEYLTRGKLTELMDKLKGEG